MSRLCFQLLDKTFVKYLNFSFQAMVTMIQDTSINHMDIMMITKVVHYSQLLTKTNSISFAGYGHDSHKGSPKR